MPDILITLKGHNDSIRSSEADKRQALVALANYIRGCAGGVLKWSGVDRRASAVAATGTLTISAGTGAVGGTINGTLVTVTWATSDTVTAAALVTAINAAAAIVSDHVTATSSGGVVTLTSKVPGHTGNAITLAASGTGVTASGARLTGGSATLTTFAP